MALLAALYVLSPTAAVLAVASLWADRRYIAAWCRWRAARPVLGEVGTYHQFRSALALWKMRRPVKSDYERA